MDFSCEDGFFRKVSLTGTKPSINVGLEIDSERAKLAKNDIERESVTILL